MIAAAPGWTPGRQLQLAAEVLAPELQQEAGELLNKARASSGYDEAHLCFRPPNGQANVVLLPWLEAAAANALGMLVDLLHPGYLKSHKTLISKCPLHCFVGWQATSVAARHGVSPAAS